MEMEVYEEDLKEIEDNMEALSGWLVNHFCSFVAAAFVLQTIQNGVKEAKAILNKNEE